MILTKPLTTFLTSNTTLTLPTLLLSTPTGKLLASASPDSASILRQHATLASSIYTSDHKLSRNGVSNVSLTHAGENNESARGEEMSDGVDGGKNDVSRRDAAARIMMIRLERETLMVCTLRCGLLLCAISTIYIPSSLPSTSQPDTPFQSTHPSSATLHTPIATAETSNESSAEHETTPQPPSTLSKQTESSAPDPDTNGHIEQSNGSRATSLAASTVTHGPEAKSLRSLRRRVGRIAAILDEELGDFTLGDGL